MFNLVMAAGFEYVVESYEIGLDVGIRICYRVADSGLCGKVHHY